MFFFFHLFTGIILGLLLNEILKDRRWIIPCTIGAVLPDLIDKPLGYLIVPSIGYGRFIFHNLILAVVLFIAGYLVWKYYASPVLFALDLGIISHQVLDSMWENPKMWIYPVLGTEIPHAASPGDFLLYLLETDLYNPVEWILLCACIIGTVAYIYRKQLGIRAARHTNAMKGIFAASRTGIIAACGIVAACGYLKIPFKDLAVTTPNQYLMVIAVLVLLLLFIHLRGKRYLSRQNHKIPEGTAKKPLPGKKNAAIEYLELLIRAKGKDPETITVAKAKAFAENIPDVKKTSPVSAHYFIRPATGIIALIAFSGCGILILAEKNIPDYIFLAGTLACGMFAGSLLAPQKKK
jgi:uncharacterized membrane protein